MKKIISFFLAVLIFALPLSACLTAVSQKSKAAGINFKCGDNATWELDENGTLAISGTGELYDDYSNGSVYGDCIPWENFSKDVKSIVIEEGITSIPKTAFLFCENAESLYIPSTLETLGANSLYIVSGNLKNITIGANSMLRNGESINKTQWYNDQPDGEPVYLGRFLVGFKGEMPENYTLNVKNGTYAIEKSAFENMQNLVEVNIPESVEHIGNKAFEGTAWYDNQPSGVVYAGSALIGVKGTVPLSQTDLVVREGTTCILPNAFKGITTITSVTMPASLKTISASAFKDCSNLEKVNFADENQLKYIGDTAFVNCQKLKSFDIPETVEYIGYMCFSDTKLSKLNLPSALKTIGYSFVSVISGDIVVTLDESNPYLYMDEYGVIYDRSKENLITAVYSMLPDEYILNENCKVIRRYAFYKGKVKRIILNDGIEYIGRSAFWLSGLEYVSPFPDSLLKIGDSAFAYCHLESIDLGNGIDYIAYNTFENNKSLTEIVIPKQIETVSILAFNNCTSLKKITFLGNTEISSNSTNKLPDDTVIYCYDNSPAHEFAIKYNLTYVLLERTTDTINLEKIMETANAVNRNLYTQESLDVLDSALSSVDLTVENLTQTQVDEWETAINTAISNLKYKPADYSSINIAKEAASKIDRTMYTTESLAELDKAVNAVDESLTVDKQSQLEGYADAINNAIANLKYKPADYTNVNEQIERANAVDKKLYSQVTVIVLNNIIASVDYSLNILQQSTVDGYASAISQAIDSLEYASVVLRHDVCGVIVSATAKEIYPDTVLAVEEVDSSEHEGTNFAVGGSIRSLHFFDINLILESQIVQPDGTVNVKIKIADGVDPKKCKVYHVTDDLVNPLVRYTSTIDGNYIVFETDHFSEFAVIEVETVLDSIEISSPPSNTLYGIGEKIDLNGLKVTARLSDGTSKEITDYTVGMVSLDSVGTKKVTVYYTMGNITKSAEFEITVSATKTSVDITESGKSIERIDKKLGLFSLYTRASISLGTDIRNAECCTVRWSSDNSKVSVDQNGTVTCNGIFGAKKAVITAEILDSNGKVIATDKITVVFYKLSFQLSNLQTVFKNTLLF